MPCSFHIDVANEVVFFTATGCITDGELVQTLMAMANDEAFDADFRGFADCTQVTEHLVSAETMQLLAGNPRSSADSRWVFLVNEGLAAGIARFYKLSLKFGHLEVFTDRATALAWINDGVPPGKFIT